MSDSIEREFIASNPLRDATLSYTELFSELFLRKIFDFEEVFDIHPLIIGEVFSKCNRGANC